MNTRTLILFAAVSVLWGVPYLLIAEALDAGLGPLTIVAARILVGGAVLMALVGPQALQVIRTAPMKLCLLAIIEVVIPFTLIAFAERSVTSGTAGVIIALEPFFVLVWSAMIARGTSPAWLRVIPGSILGFAGVLVLLGTPGGGIGAWLLVGAAASYGLGAVLVGRWFATTSSLSVSAAMLVIAAPITVAIALPLEGRPELTVQGVSAVLLLGAACTAGGFATFFSLIKTAGAHSASLITYVAPVIALLAGIVVRAEPISIGSGIGTALILLGAWMCLRRTNNPTPTIASRRKNPS